ncbi:tRNA preQ1(34) S-adenosylmethionine ribosyltransferase-isomerase QueA [Lentisphaerota bacterium ZTH]|nr:tRNA preQ1(34) S-adenosylmethionine ribosyltransferase-isomerase QueA [Lentisphaerota bacterium]WET05716.1 tRNA preQ1(34) S-adenosylmethionine ribosyltransferase-isomerase QueA [Lentisphaerota bacterium ZTH]
MKLSTDLFDYYLPEELIAQYPAASRDASRMLVMERKTGRCEVRTFKDIVEYLSPGDGLIFNDTRVMSARMYGIKNGEQGAAKVELLLISALNEERSRWNALIKPGRRVPSGTRVKLLDKQGSMNDSDDWYEVLEKCDDGSVVIEFSSSDNDRLQHLYGHMPLPPYIKREDEAGDIDRYQTVFAREQGAVAAPTAGLHFTDEVLEQIKRKGIKKAAVTLHVGPGTFRPVSVDNVDEHKMHTENFVLTQDTADLINGIHDAGKRVLAVGTTTVRVLESCVDRGRVIPQVGSTDIFLYPPYQPQAVDMLLTNFHLPKSTLLMLVSTFADRDKVLAAYEVAKREKMRFYSYGDCMLLV